MQTLGQLATSDMFKDKLSEPCKDQIVDLDDVRFDIYQTMLADKMPYRKLFRVLKAADKTGWVRDPVLKYAYKISLFHDRDIVNNRVNQDNFVFECIRLQNKYEATYGLDLSITEQKSASDTCAIL